MSIADSDFTQYSQTEGILRMEMMGQVEEIPSKSTNYLDASGTIGCAEVDVDEKINYMMISNTAGGIVLTMTGEEDGPMDIELPGYAKIMVGNADADFERVLELHREGLGDSEAIADEAWLKEETPGVPQRATDVVSAAMAKAMGMFEGLGEAMGDAMEGMGKVLGDAMEGMGEAMAEAMGGEEKPEPEETDDA